MATPTTLSRYVSGVGIKTGFTDNTGLSYDITPINFLTANGTSSMSGTFSVYPQKNKTFVNLITAPTTGVITTGQVVINATYSQIFDELEIIAIGPVTSGTFSLVLSGNVVEVTSLTNTIPAGKAAKITGIYNGTNYIMSGSITA